MFEVLKSAKAHGLSLKGTEVFKDPLGHVAWQATLMHQDSPIATVRCGGWAGSPAILKVYNKDAFKSVVKKAYLDCIKAASQSNSVQYAAAAYKIKPSSTFESQVRELAQNMLEEHERLAALKKHMQSNILFIDPADPHSTGMVKLDPTPVNIEIARQKYPAYILLNEELGGL